MEITKINIISDFEAGMKCLQSPSLMSRFSLLSGIEKVPQVYIFWKWGAVFLALVAAFSSIINRIKHFIIWVRTVKPLVASSSSKHLLQEFDDDDFDFSDDDVSSSVGSDDDDDGESESTSSFEDSELVDEDFRVAASSCYREDPWRRGGDRFSWSDFASGKSVVKLWDSFGLNLDFEDSSESEISIWDFNKDQKISSFFCGESQIPALAMVSPAVVFSAEVNNGDNVVVGAYDTRVASKIPAVYAKWGRRRGPVVGVNLGGVEKVYVRNCATGALTVGDLRNVKTPLDSLLESDGDTWWDADAVIGQDEFVDEL